MARRGGLLVGALLVYAVLVVVPPSIDGFPCGNGFGDEDEDAVGCFCGVCETFTLGFVCQEKFCQADNVEDKYKPLCQFFSESQKGKEPCRHMGKDWGRGRWNQTTITHFMEACEGLYDILSTEDVRLKLIEFQQSSSTRAAWPEGDVTRVCTGQVPTSYAEFASLSYACARIVQREDVQQFLASSLDLREATILHLLFKNQCLSPNQREGDYPQVYPFWLRHQDTGPDAVPPEGWIV